MSTYDAERIPEFDRSFVPENGRIARIGEGDVGGKAAGLLQVQQEVLGRLDAERHGQFFVSVPSFVVLSTECLRRLHGRQRPLCNRRR